MATRPRAIRVLTADSNQMACRLLAEALGKEPGLAVVASASDYESMMQCWQSATPDIVLMSAALPGGLLRLKAGTAPGAIPASGLSLGAIARRKRTPDGCKCFSRGGERCLLAHAIGYSVTCEVCPARYGRAGVGG